MSIELEFSLYKLESLGFCGVQFFWRSYNFVGFIAKKTTLISSALNADLCHPHESWWPLRCLSLSKGYIVLYCIVLLALKGGK
jgi:hypothetical protein